MSRKTPRWAGIAVTLTLVAIAFAVGYGLGREQPAPVVEPAAQADEEWTCSMHPQVRLPQPGDCPICKMDLIPVTRESAPEGLALSDASRRRAGVRTAVVERRYPVVEIRMVGKIDVDETRVGTITSDVPGRLERLYVDYTWVPVQKGDHLVELYSPELIAAQEELLQAIVARDRLVGSDMRVMRETAAMTVDASRERLHVLGMLPEQIAALEREGRVTERTTLFSPMSGIVTEMNARQGMYVDTGTPIYTIADLDTVWVKLQAFESDLAWVHLGQQVSFTADAYPGESFDGRVAFIDPTVDPRTRTINVRLNVDNREGRLKPEMLVRATLRAQVVGEGTVYDPALAGKWISPMHPWVVKDGPGTCDVCGMNLVRSEQLGYARGSGADTAPLIVPATAPLITGRRAVIYVEVEGDDGPRYEGREVVLGPRAGDVYVVREGLAEGDRVVVEGNFRIDSALQIKARPSMMEPD